MNFYIVLKAITKLTMKLDKEGYFEKGDNNK